MILAVSKYEKSFQVELSPSLLKAVPRKWNHDFQKILSSRQFFQLLPSMRQEYFKDHQYFHVWQNDKYLYLFQKSMHNEAL